VQDFEKNSVQKVQAGWRLPRLISRIIPKYCHLQRVRIYSRLLRQYFAVFDEISSWLKTFRISSSPFCGCAAASPDFIDGSLKANKNNPHRQKRENRMYISF